MGFLPSAATFKAYELWGDTQTIALINHVTCLKFHELASRKGEVRARTGLMLRWIGCAILLSSLAPSRMIPTGQDHAADMSSRTYSKEHTALHCFTQHHLQCMLPGVAWGSGQPCMQREGECSHTSCNCTGLWGSAGSCPRLP